MDKRNRNILFAVIAILLIVASIVGAYQLGKKSNNVSYKDALKAFENVYEFSEEVKGADKTNDIAEMKKYIADIKSKNVYMQVNHTQEGFQTVILNNKGQGVIQDSETGSIEVLLGDSHSVLYTDNINLIQDVTALDLLDFAIDAVEQNYAKIYKDKEYDDNVGEAEGYKLRYIDVVGIDNIAKLYSNVSKEFSDIFMENLKLGTQGTNVVALRFLYFTPVEESENFAAGCNILLDSEEYMSWNFENYVEIYDWELGPDWFDIDYSDVENNTKLEGMLEVLIKELDEILHEYAKENNLDGYIEDITNGENDEAINKVEDEHTDETTDEELVDNNDETEETEENADR